jgi:hypothetical protein
VVPPIRLTPAAFLKSAVVNPWDLYGRLKATIRLSTGRLECDWENALFPGSAVELRRSLFNWARIHLVGHALMSRTTGTRATSQVIRLCYIGMVHVAFLEHPVPYQQRRIADVNRTE